MPEGRRFVVVVEYELDQLNPETTAEIGRIVRERLVEEKIAGAVFRVAHGVTGEKAFRVIELLPPK